MPHAAQIAFAFFTYVANEKDICCRFELSAFQRLGDSQKSGYSGCIVTDTGPIEPVGFFTRLQRSALREYGIQMRADANERRTRLVMQKAENVSQIVVLNIFQAERSKSLEQPFASRSLAKRRSWDFSKRTLPATKLHFLIVQV
jgi:hypothetical protein